MFVILLQITVIRFYSGEFIFRKQIKDTLDTTVKIFSHASKNWFTVRHIDPLK